MPSVASPTLPSSANAPLSGQRSHHWVLPFASSLSEACQQAFKPLDAALPQMPHWQRLVSQLSQHTRTEGDEYALSMPHERVLGQALGWCDAPEPGQGLRDGLLPWSCWWAQQDGVSLDPDLAWGLLSPGHWLMGREQLTLLDPATLGLSEADSRALFEALLPLFDGDGREGWTLRWGSATRWYAAHPSLAGLPTASLDRVIGRNPDVWLTDNPQARLLRRLQSEVQMLLYQHPVNDARQAAGLPSINSFWISGCGLPQAHATLPAHLHGVDDLRTPLLADDMAVWLDAWRHLDATVFKAACDALDAGEPVQLSLCGERHVLTLSERPRSRKGLSGHIQSAWLKLTGGSKAPMPSALLRDL